MLSKDKRSPPAVPKNRQLTPQPVNFIFSKIREGGVQWSPRNYFSVIIECSKQL